MKDTPNTYDDLSNEQGMIVVILILFLKKTIYILLINESVNV